MASLRPVEVYNLRVPCGDIMVEATEVPTTFRITMAALDPTAPPQTEEDLGEIHPRATLKLIREPVDDSDDEDYEDEDSDDVGAIEARLGMTSDDEDESLDDEEVNGGPSDPSKTKKARELAAVQQLVDSLQNGKDEDMEDGPLTNGVKSSKGKARASDDDLEDESDGTDYGAAELEETVICTLDTSKTYQQPLDITINEGERVYFKVIGTHDIFLTGNYLVDLADMDHQHSDDDDEELDEMYSNPYLDALGDEDMDGESNSEEDELDDLDDPRITEVESEDEAPKLIQAAEKKSKNKNKNKRPADDSADEDAVATDLLQQLLKPQTNGDAKLSKKERKKLKNNAGQAVAAAEQDVKSMKKEMLAKDSPAKTDKKVQFAKNLEQGPTGSPKPADAKKDAKTDKKEAKEEKKDDKKPSGIKVVQGVKIDDKKLGSGPAAKKGNKVGMRYIGKLAKDNKVFDSNKKGKPFTFKLGTGEVIKGWDIGIAGMSVGGERRITIPAHLAYGSKKMGSDIPPNSDLIFDIKMIELQ